MDASSGYLVEFGCANQAAARTAAPGLRGSARGWLVRRALLIADVLGFTARVPAYRAHLRLERGGRAHRSANEYLLFVASLPFWMVGAKLYRLYDHDEERADHTTLEDLVGVFHLVTTGRGSSFVAMVLADPPTRPGPRS